MGEKDVKAKLSLPPGPSLFPDAFEFNEALLPCRLCRLGGSSMSVCGTRTIVRRLVRDRAGFMLTSLCSPQGSAAATEPRRADSLRARAFGPRTGLSSGEVTALILGCDAGRRGERDEYCEPIDADGETYLGSDEDGVRRGAFCWPMWACGEVVVGGREWRRPPAAGLWSWSPSNPLRIAEYVKSPFPWAAV